MESEGVGEEANKSGVYDNFRVNSNKFQKDQPMMIPTCSPYVSKDGIISQNNNNLE